MRSLSAAGASRHGCGDRGIRPLQAERSAERVTVAVRGPGTVCARRMSERALRSDVSVVSAQTGRTGRLFRGCASRGTGAPNARFGRAHRRWDSTDQAITSVSDLSDPSVMRPTRTRRSGQPRSSQPGTCAEHRAGSLVAERSARELHQCTLSSDCRNAGPDQSDRESVGARPGWQPGTASRRLPDSAGPVFPCCGDRPFCCPDEIVTVPSLRWHGRCGHAGTDDGRPYPRNHDLTARHGLDNT